MCGLFGYITKWDNGFFKPGVDTFKQLMLVDSIRGEDATGIALVNKYQGVSVLKEATTGGEFAKSIEVKALLSDAIANGKVLMGHNRKTTIGKDVDVNAHPFVYEDRYVFFHNGTLENHRKIKNTEVDSDALGSLLTSCEGDLTKLNEAINSISGAYACTWYDAEKHTIYWLRNTERPLHLVLLENEDVLYTSEPWMVYGCASRNNLKIKDTLSIEPHHLYSITLTDNKLVIVKEALEKKAPPTISFTGTRMVGSTNKVPTKKERKLLGKLLVNTPVVVYPYDYLESSGESILIHEGLYTFRVYCESVNYPTTTFILVLHNMKELDLIRMIDQSTPIEAEYQKQITTETGTTIVHLINPLVPIPCLT